MKKSAGLSYFLLALLCFSLINFRLSNIERLRGPFFGFEELFAYSSVDSKSLELAELKSENIHLKSQIEEVKAYLLADDHLESVAKRCASYADEESSEHSFYCQKKLDQMMDYLNLTKWQITANVIYREPANWSSAIWIDAGYAKNKLYSKTIIAVDSPVVFGDYLIGVIEKVDKYKSLVRLITDSRVSPSVRCVRGDEQLSHIFTKCKQLKEILDLYPKEKFIGLIAALDESLLAFSLDGESSYLGKGYLTGSAHPIWRSRSLTLQGVGFNYDFSDDEGPARLLHDSTDVPLFQIGDVLITTGMDGVFPPNLITAFVTEVSPLKEGAISCDLKAKAALSELSDLRKVTILPPITEEK